MAEKSQWEGVEMTAGAEKRSLFAVVAAVFLCSLLAFASFIGCGGGTPPVGEPDSAVEAATAFLNALGDQDTETLRVLMSQEYLDANDIPDPITREGLVAAMGYLNSYRFTPDEDVTITGERAAVIVDLDITGKGEMEETLILSWEDGEWKVADFTALDWSQQAVAQDEENVEVELALRNFLIACIDGRTDYIFENLSQGYKDRHRLEKPWTSAEFSGVFGTARSFDFDPNEIDMMDEDAEVDVTVEFGSRGNLESETARVGLVKEGNTWLIDVFPFFIY